MRVLLFSLGVVLVDQVTKLLVKGIHIPTIGLNVDGMVYGESRPIIGDFFRLTYIENPGMAFGIEIGGKMFLSLFSLFACILIVYYMYTMRHESMGLRISLAMILGGAAGNLIDRIFYGVLFGHGPLFHGRVVDFFDVDFFNIDILGYQMSRWPVFNIADASVTVGVILLVFLNRPLSSKKKMETDHHNDVQQPAHQESSSPAL